MPKSVVYNLTFYDRRILSSGRTHSRKQNSPLPQRIVTGVNPLKLTIRFRRMEPPESTSQTPTAPRRTRLSHLAERRSPTPGISGPSAVPGFLQEMAHPPMAAGPPATNNKRLFSAHRPDRYDRTVSALTLRRSRSKSHPHLLK